MKVKVKKGRVENIALMSIPALGIAVISLPVAVLLAVGFGSMLEVLDNGEIEIDLSFNQWMKVVEAQHATEEEKKRLETLYWRNQHTDAAQLSAWRDIHK